jgi:uncharacterized integral membrane protein (TIGR00698 family)
MSQTDARFGGAAARERETRWIELWKKEDWWAIWLGLSIVIVGLVLFTYGASWRWVAVVPPKWTSAGQLGGHFADNWLRYVAQFAFWSAAFSVALGAMGRKARDFLPAFAFLYALSLLVFVIGQWDRANYYGFEAPLVALVTGLVIANTTGLPASLDAGFRVEFYIKTGIVLMGATIPFTLIVWAGPVAIVQASIVSITTFCVIYFTAKRFGIDRRLAAVLGAGGAVCGVSAAIAISGAVGAKKEDAPIAITLVLLWAIVMIFILPFVAHAMNLSAGVAGAWIGTSEFADAAGIAAAQTYADMIGGATASSGEQAVQAFTLMKVVGRDVWIGIWAFVLALIATTRWEAGTMGRKANAAEIWWRFPKFVMGFFAASLLVTWVTRGYSLADFNKLVNPILVAPIKDLRSWAFIFCFLSIGLTTRFRELAPAGNKPFFAFTAGVAVNVVLGFVLSAWLFASYWTNLSP